MDFIQRHLAPHRRQEGRVAGCVGSGVQVPLTGGKPARLQVRRHVVQRPALPVSIATRREGFQHRLQHGLRGHKTVQLGEFPVLVIFRVAQHGVGVEAHIQRAIGPVRRGEGPAHQRRAQKRPYHHQRHAEEPVPQQPASHGAQSPGFHSHLLIARASATASAGAGRAPKPSAGNILPQSATGGRRLPENAPAASPASSGRRL